MDYLRKIYKDDLEDTIVSFINAETTKTRGSLIDVLKHGIEISNRQLDLMYTKPATTFNPELMKKYSQNIFSVMEEVWASDKERIDVVIFLNGLAIISFELKCNTAGQSYQDAIYQYRTERNPKTRLFLFKAGCIVNFAIDVYKRQVYERETREIVRVLKAHASDVMPAIDLMAYQEKLALLESNFEINRQRIAEKVKEPSKTISLEDTDTRLLEIGAMINEINKQIKENNDVVSAKRSSKTKCKTEIMQYLAFMLAADVKDVYKRQTYRYTSVISVNS